MLNKSLSHVILMSIYLRAETNIYFNFINLLIIFQINCLVHEMSD